MKKKLMAMVLGMAVCVGQVEAFEGKFPPSPIPSPSGSPVETLLSWGLSSLLDNQFGELLSSAVD